MPNFFCNYFKANAFYRQQQTYHLHKRSCQVLFYKCMLVTFMQCADLSVFSGGRVTQQHKNFAPPHDCHPYFLTRACPPPPEFCPWKFQKFYHLINPTLTTVLAQSCIRKLYSMLKKTKICSNFASPPSSDSMIIHDKTKTRIICLAKNQGHLPNYQFLMKRTQQKDQRPNNWPVSHSARHQGPARERHKIRIASRENVDNQTPRNTNFTH